MAHIFISYRKVDRALCLAMYDRLRDAGHSVWWDDDLRPGREWAPMIEAQLRRADAVVVLWTANATRSKWVYFEAMMAAGMGKLVMLKIGKVDEPGGVLGNYNFYSYDPETSADSGDWHMLQRRIDEAVIDGSSISETAPSFDDVIWSLTRRSVDAEDFADYFVRYPEGAHADEAARRLERLRIRGRRRRVFWWSVGLVLYAAIALPATALILDYGWPHALFWSVLYFPLFGYSVLFGTMMVPIFCFTLAKALRFAWRREGRSRRSRWSAAAFLVGAPALACLAITVVEVSDGYAPWQFRQAILDTPLSGLAGRQASSVAAVSPGNDFREDARPLHTVFERTADLSLSSLWDDRNSQPGDHYCLAASQQTPRAPLEARRQACLRHMNNLQLFMEAIRADQSNWSMTAYAYKFCFFFLAFMFIGTYFVVFYLSWQAEELRGWLARLSPWSGQRFSQLLILLGVQLVLIMFWFISRMVYQLETATILPDSGGAQYSQSIRNSYFLFLAVYLVAVGFLFQAAARVNNLRVRIGLVVASVLMTILFGCSFFFTAFIRSVQAFVGVRANPASLVVMGIVLVFVLFVPLILPNLMDWPEPDLRRTKLLEADDE